MKKILDPDEQWFEKFVADHPVIKSGLPEREAAKILMRDAELANPVLVKRFFDKLALDTITRACDCVQRGDEKKARRILKGLSPDSIESLLRTVNRMLDDASIRKRERCRPQAGGPRKRPHNFQR